MKNNHKPQIINPINSYVSIRRICTVLVAVFCFSMHATADPDAFSVSVSGGNTFTISRTDASAASYVDYYTQGGTAIASIHFTDVSGRLEFAVGETSKTVIVPLLTVSSIDKYVYYGATRYFNFFTYNNAMSQIRTQGTITNGVNHYILYVSGKQINMLLDKNNTLC